MPERLHPRLGAVLKDAGWTGLTTAQDAAYAPILEGRHVLLVAPTGHGKTEAAVIPVFDRLLRERDALTRRGRPWPTGFKALYITPLRALNRDLLGRLEHWGHALDLRVGVRHGDTSQYERSKQSRSPPDLLITTPETLQLLLYGDRLRQHLATVRFVVLDEVHALAGSERGAQLTIALERLEEAIAQPEEIRLAPARQRPCPRRPHGASGFQRIGLSATVADPDAVAHFMTGDRDIHIARVDAAKQYAFNVTVPEATKADADAGARVAAPPAAMAQLRVVRSLVSDNHRTLVFQNTRDQAELMASRSAVTDDLLELHHGSLSADVRADVETRFKQGAIRGLVATSSLELGIDVGEIDHVVQVHSPRSVARLVQRMGRAGHRVGATSHGTLVAGDPEDVLECMVVARMATEGHLEPVATRDAPLAVLANQIVALTNEYTDLDPDWVHAVVTRAAPFTDLDEGMFRATWDALMEAKTVFGQAGHLERSGRSRRHFLDHIGMIPDERTYRVLDEAGKRVIGSVDDAFAIALHPGALFVMAGRPWQVLEIDAEDTLVRVAPVRDVGAVPQWAGKDLPVSRMVAGHVARLRRLILEDDPELESYPADAAARAAARTPIDRQTAAGLEVPTDQTVTIETARRMVTINVALGTRGNEALGRITQALLAQRHGTVGLDTDAYRIHLTLPGTVDLALEELWDSIDPDSLDVILSIVLADSPTAKHHLVQVAKWFGALPDAVDPNRFGRAKAEALMAQTALQEETLSRLIHDRLDTQAAADFLRDVQAGRLRIVHQALGPISTLAQEARGAMVAPPKTDATLLAEVRRRIEDNQVVLACTQCRHTWDGVVKELPRRIKCRRCGSIQVACVGPWAKDIIRSIGQDVGPEARKDRDRLIRNAGIVAGFGSLACRALSARGIGPDGATRLLQKVADPEDPRFWRELLVMELEFARNSAYWRR